MGIGGKIQISWFVVLLLDAPGYRPVALGLTGMAVATLAWSLFWPVPTEVVGRGVLIVPGDAFGAGA